MKSNTKKKKRFLAFCFFAFTFIGGWFIDRIVDYIIGEPVDSVLEYSFDEIDVIFKSSYNTMKEYLAKNKLKEVQTKAQNGDLEAQFNLGTMYYFGEYVDKDYKEAIKWWRNIAELGDVRAQFYLGVMYAHGWGVTQNYKEAVKWYRKAAEQDYVAAQCNLGYMYSKGVGSYAR